MTSIDPPIKISKVWLATNLTDYLAVKLEAAHPAIVSQIHRQQMLKHPNMLNMLNAVENPNLTPGLSRAYLRLAGLELCACEGHRRGAWVLSNLLEVKENIGNLIFSITY